MDVRVSDGGVDSCSMCESDTNFERSKDCLDETATLLQSNGRQVCLEAALYPCSGSAAGAKLRARQHLASHAVWVCAG